MDKNILVPFDFSNEANYALEHAYELSRYTNLEIHLLYVVSTEYQVEEWLVELTKIADAFSHDKHCTVVPVVKAGNLFETIFEYGTESNAYIAVMGTHGIKTIKKAMKVITRFEKLPFILVQRPITFGPYDRICVPIDDDKKSRLKFLWVKYLDYLFKSTVYIVYPDTANVEKKAAINANLNFATTVLADSAIDFDIKAVPEDDYADNMYDYMKEVEPDVVLFMSEKYKQSLLDIHRARNIELAKKIPIMCVNHRTDIMRLGGFNH